MPLRLHLEGVGLKLGGRWLFQGITTTFEAGQAWAVVGPNGIGKTSFLALLAGYLSPTTGAIHGEIAGRLYRPEALSQRLFWQSPAVQPPPDLFVRDVVHDFSRQKGLREEDLAAAYSDLPTGARLYELSSGMRQRLLVKLALTAPTGIVLLDEPTAFLDLYHKEQVLSALTKRLHDPQLLLICATNDPEEAKLFPKSLSLLKYAA
jgi:iron complex transport system ATP-binding protein